ncbi:hypothetical protein PAPYR_9227 [Paratrimastix pyriformis]|uniref:Uncharacterized protein n=1 Tax=Paratrimastix pyriformis TaxID=342808 RepID=A0ABQ8UEH5_9EUKA|nr:hypothetical protein PAPYR_9227 [Paratrimastix pyriformis]
MLDIAPWCPTQLIDQPSDRIASTGVDRGKDVPEQHAIACLSRCLTTMKNSQLRTLRLDKLRPVNRLSLACPRLKLLAGIADPERQLVWVPPAPRSALVEG